ncbi:DUF6090 family protein [Winogradskyella sp.]|uniref:DUF6090 family protein n=1 Tax=Winogradskyella sp. TaxID=1883156 RepID=UPI003BA9B481
MIKFFRKIRQRLLAENRFSKYLLYAIGEIILVVIGILIALQINDWNQDRINATKEHQFLGEIIINLEEDMGLIDMCLVYNKNKFKAIDSAFHFMSLMKNNKSLGKQFSSLLPVLTNSEFFYPSRVTFDGIISTGQIEIIRSSELRKQISNYYSDKSLDGVQEQLKINTQSFLDITTPKMINQEMAKFFTKRDFDVIPLERLTIHKDPDILAKLFVMLNKTKEHNQRLTEMRTKITTLKDIITQQRNTY